jgi:hypothetical protein
LNTCRVEDGEQGNADIGEDGFPHRRNTDGAEGEEGHLDGEGEDDILPDYPSGKMGDVYSLCQLGRFVGHQHHIGGLDSGVGA